MRRFRTLRKGFKHMKNDKNKRNDNNPANKDPITGAPGAHPVGTGVGAAAAGAAGAAIGAVGGPVGAAVGLVAGSVIGGLAGKGVGEKVNPTEEDAYWRENHRTQTFAGNRPYEEYAGAYRTGYEGYTKYGSNYGTCDECDADLAADYDRNRGKSQMKWEEAKHAARAAWNRVSDRQRTQAEINEEERTGADSSRYATGGPQAGRPATERYEPKERSKP